MDKITINTNKQCEIINIDSYLLDYIQSKGISDGFIFIHVPHTTAAITINENADPDVKTDILLGLKRFDNENYNHSEGNSPAHIKSSLMGCNITVKIEKGQMMLGTWQSVMLCEFDGPRNRKIWVDING